MLVLGRQVARKTRCLVRKILLGSVGATGLIVLLELRGSLDRVVVQVDRVDHRFPIFAQGPRLGSVGFSIYHLLYNTLYELLVAWSSGIKVQMKTQSRDLPG